MNIDNVWTAEEYREYLRTGKEPARRAKLYREATAAERAALEEQIGQKIPKGTGMRVPATSPCCCQAARSSGVTLADMEPVPEIKEQSLEGRFDGAIARFKQIDRETETRKAEIAKTVREAGKKPRKYRNEPVTVDGIRFDSKHEAKVYQELMLRVSAGEIKVVLLQVAFLLPGNIKYVADFVTITPDMRIEGVYDAKSEATKKNRVYINKKKQMKACWGIEIKEV